jgi:transcriptional regulator with XRE-family HTH domain
VKRPSSKRVLKDLGRRVAELRQGLELTQAALADRLTVTSRYVQSVEAGRENLTVESLTVLATVLDVPVGSLFDPPASRVVRVGRPKR